MSGTSYQSLWVSKNVYIYQTLIFWFGPLNLKTRKKRKKNPTKHWICQAVSLSFKTCLQTFIFWSGPLKSGNWKEKEKKTQQNIEYVKQYLWVSKHVYKHSFFGLVLWIWKLERKGKKTKHWISQEQKELFSGNKKHFHNFWNAFFC